MNSSSCYRLYTSERGKNADLSCNHRLTPTPNQEVEDGLESLVSTYQRRYENQNELQFDSQAIRVYTLCHLLLDII